MTPDQPAAAQPAVAQPAPPAEQPYTPLPSTLPAPLRQPLSEAPPPPSQPPPQAPGDRPLELLAFFAATGTLPWWAPRHDARLIPAALNAALRLPSEHLAPFLRQLAAAPMARQRLLAALDPAQRLLVQASPGRDAPQGETISPAADPSVDPAAPPLTPEIAAHSRPSKALDAAEVWPSSPIGEARRATPPLQPGEELLVDGAGLVLLWPFLETLLDRLEWLTPERRFVGAVEQQRAMALLGFLVEGDPRPPEWRLSLAKLLCGVPLESLAGLEGDLSATERAEAEKLLRATLAHAEGRLGEEIGGLREQWLRRPGLLTWRPGAWLLVVERREEVDGPLERLPWSWGWIRLPWMRELVQVAW